MTNSLSLKSLNRISLYMCTARDPMHAPWCADFVALQGGCCGGLSNAHGRGIYRTEKPVAQSDLLVRVNCLPDGLVGDWLAGPGAVDAACKLVGCRYVGSEIDPGMAQRARDRLAATLPFPVGEPS